MVCDMIRTYHPVCASVSRRFDGPRQTAVLVAHRCLLTDAQEEIHLSHNRLNSAGAWSVSARGQTHASHAWLRGTAATAILDAVVDLGKAGVYPYRIPTKNGGVRLQVRACSSV